MFAGEMTKYRMQDRMREAEAYRTYRVAKAARASRAASGRSRSRRVGSGMLAALIWPVRH